VLTSARRCIFRFMSTVDEIADRHVAEYSVLNPIIATSMGITGYDDLMTDLSPAGFEAMTDLNRRTLAELAKTEPAGYREQVAREAMVERLTVYSELYDSSAANSDLNVVACWLQAVRQVFDLMPVHGEEAQRNLASRMRGVGTAYAGYRQTLLDAAHNGHVAARRQVVACARQCADWTAPGTAFYDGLVGRTEATGTMRAELELAARAANAATAEFGQFLQRELLPLAREKDAVGRERFGLLSRQYLGTTIDPDEAYDWGWQEVIRIEREMTSTADEIVPGGCVADAVKALDADPERRIFGRDALKDWMQGIADATIAELNGTHFDIPEPARTIECMIAPTEDGGIYYTAPNEDWSRPGRMWWAPGDGVEDFSTWKELTTIYHEGVPGHHLQVAQAIYLQGQLNRWQRLMCWVSGHGEGWALYAERLMDELGYLSDPGDKLGMLDAQLLRAARVVVDLGVHVELPIPEDSPWHPGEPWNAELAWEFLRSRVQVDDAMLRFELDRYFGWAGQSSAYKLGERIWLNAREEVRQRKGAEFDLKQFHSQALALGSLGLDPLQKALARF
jgi:uncharacterized protein (DUF885 family)